jgi:hypothetical protein
VRLAWGGGGWIRLAQDRDRWRAVVGAVMNVSCSCATELFSVSQTGVSAGTATFKQYAENLLHFAFK